MFPDDPPGHKRQPSALTAMEGSESGS